MAIGQTSGESGPQQLLAEAEAELRLLDESRSELAARIERLRHEATALPPAVSEVSSSYLTAPVTQYSSEAEKIRLFRALFRGREDVYPKRFESVRTGRSGYQPDCANEWVSGLCAKPKVKCKDCSNRQLIPVTDDAIRCHLMGHTPGSRRGFTIGVYPLLSDDTCWFLAADFDKQTWQDDVGAFTDTCDRLNVPAAVERSRSGNGAHVWVFFTEPLPARLARQLGCALVTETMERRPEIGLDSYDRLFPNQDTVPQGGFGNLIALPLQKTPRAQGNSVFVDHGLRPYPDQWAFLSTLPRMPQSDVGSLVDGAARKGCILGIRLAAPGEDDEEPWTAPPSRRRKPAEIRGPLPKTMDLVLGNQVYVPKAGLPPALVNRLVRMAAFQNPEFYKKQAMRLATYATPRIIGCAEEFPLHVGLPRGCLDEILTCFEEVGIGHTIQDERNPGQRIKARFTGRLRREQRHAAQAMLEHDTGVLAATTAFGKTVVAAYLIASRRVNTLILVHNRELLDQWLARLGTFLDVPPDQIGQVRGGKKKPTGVIDVAMIQSLSRKGVVEDLVGGYGHIVVDECHHIPARSFEVVARQSKARFVTGLSATVTRKDGHQPIIFMNCGPVRHRVNAKEQAAKRPFEHRLIVRQTQTTMDVQSDVAEGRPTIHDLYRALIHDPQRNVAIRDDVVDCAREGRSPVVLTERREHLDILAELLLPCIPNVIVLKGGMGVKERRRQLSALVDVSRDGPRVLLATGRYLGEGFDDPRLDTLFLTLPISWRGTIAQYAGRLHRVHEGKREVRIYDYVDVSIPMAAKMHQRRCVGYRALGYTVEDDGGPGLSVG